MSVHSGPGRPASRHSHAGRVATHGARHLLGTPSRRPHSHARSRQPEPRPAPRLAPQTQTPSEALGGPRGEPVWRGLRSSPRHSGGPSRDRRSVRDGGLQGNYLYGIVRLLPTAQTVLVAGGGTALWETEPRALLGSFYEYQCGTMPGWGVPLDGAPSKVEGWGTWATWLCGGALALRAAQHPAASGVPGARGISPPRCRRAPAPARELLPAGGRERGVLSRNCAGPGPGEGARAFSLFLATSPQSSHQAPPQPWALATPYVKWDKLKPPVRCHEYPQPRGAVVGAPSWPRGPCPHRPAGGEVGGSDTPEADGAGLKAALWPAGPAPTPEV